MGSARRGAAASGCSGQILFRQGIAGPVSLPQIHGSVKSLDGAARCNLQSRDHPA